MEFEELVEHLADLIELARSERFLALANHLEATRHYVAGPLSPAMRERSSVDRETDTITAGDVGPMLPELFGPVEPKG